MSSSKDPKDILKGIKAEILGVSPDDIIFSSFRDKKRRRKKPKKTVESESDSTIIGNQEGFSLTNMEVEVISYDKIGKRRRLKDKDTLEEWGAFDFFIYAKEKYRKKYGSNWDLIIGGSSLEINKVRDGFYDLFGFCCNLIMRDYIDFFFDNYMDDLVRAGESFYFSKLRGDKVMCEFYEGYDFPQSFSGYAKNEKTDNKILLTNNAIKESYLIGVTSLISNYGIVISLNWLVVVKKMTALEAAQLVVSACKTMHDRGMIDVVKSATELYSPYPNNLPFKSPQLVMDKIDENIKLSVEFNHNDTLKFLQDRR